MRGRIGDANAAGWQIAVLGLAFLLAAPRALAEVPEAESPFEARAEASQESVGPLQRAREAFLEGRRLMGEGDWEQAAQAFDVALAAMPTPGLHYYLGVCLEQLGDPLGARKAYVESRALLARDPAADVEALLPAAFQRVEAKLGRLEVTIRPHEGTARVDGSTWTAARAPWLPPGPHVLYAEAPGYEGVHLHFEVTAGALTELHVTLPPLRAESPPPPAEQAPQLVPPPGPPPPLESPPRRSALPPAAFWGSVAFGVVGAGVGVAGALWHVDASARVAEAQADLDAAGSTSSSACFGPPMGTDHPCDELRAAVSHEESATLVIVAGATAAGLGAVGAVASWLAWPDEKFALRGRVGWGRAELQLRGRF